jgi:hypothetical protein
VTPQQIDLIHDAVLFEQGTRNLRKWLHSRGVTLSLYELDRERRRRRPDGIL